MAGIWRRLRRRTLVQWTFAYLAGAWALLQLLDLVGQQFGWPPLLLRGITLALGLGLPLTLTLAWYHGERGEQRVSGVELMVLALLLAIGGGLLWRYAQPPAAARQATIADTAPVPRAAAAPADPKSIAVLPFANDSGDHDQQYFSDGLSQDLITALSQFAGLKVISRNSAFQFRDSRDDARTIGDKLGVAHLLEGSVRRAGDEVRVTAELVKAVDGSTLWSQRYDRPYKNLFELQDDITAAVAGALKAKLLVGDGVVVQSDRPPSGNLQAYSEYLQGTFATGHGSEAGFRDAIGHYRKAIDLDPRYASAYAALSQTWARMATGLLGGARRQEAYANARAAIDTALALDPQLALAHSNQAYLLTYADFNWAAAETSIRRALQLAPGESTAEFRLAFLLAARGRREEAIDVARRTLETDPRRPGAYLLLARYLSMPGRLEEAKAAVEKGIELEPQAASLHEQLAIIEILRGDPTAALIAARQEPAGSSWRNAALALALQAGGDRRAADLALKTLIAADADVAPYQIAEVYALRNDPDKAFEWLDRAWDSRDPGISLLLFDPFLLHYKDDPRFAAFCRKAGLPEPGSNAG